MLDDYDVACMNFNMSFTRETMVGLGAEMEDLRKILKNAFRKALRKLPADIYYHLILKCI